MDSYSLFRSSKQSDSTQMYQVPVYDTRQPDHSIYPATGPPPPPQVIHTQDPTIYKQDENFNPQPGHHTVTIVDGYSQQQTLMQKQDKKQLCFMTICALCLCCLQDGY